MHVLKDSSVIKLNNRNITYKRQEELVNEARFLKVNIAMHCNICSQLNNTHDHDYRYPIKQSMVSLIMYVNSRQAYIIIRMQTCPLLNSTCSSYVHIPIFILWICAQMR